MKKFRASRDLAGIIVTGGPQRAAISALLPYSVGIAIFALIASVLLAGCAESNAERASRMGNLLMESGFRALSANTPKRMQKLSEMTPLKVTAGSRKGKPAYWMADPYVCQCLWVGNQRDYDAYRQLRSAEAADANSAAAEQARYDEFVANPANETFYGD